MRRGIGASEMVRRLDDAIADDRRDADHRGEDVRRPGGGVAQAGARLGHVVDQCTRRCNGVA
jgi:hypothetical protein